MTTTSAFRRAVGLLLFAGATAVALVAVGTVMAGLLAVSLGSRGAAYATFALVLGLAEGIVAFGLAKLSSLARFGTASRRRADLR